MNEYRRIGWLILMAIGLLAPAARAEELYSRQLDVIYGRKYGLALTMDVFVPQRPNGAAVVLCVSGGWASDRDSIQPAFLTEVLKRGYTTFAVVHGSQPKFTIPECVADIDRAVRFIRSRSAEYRIDPHRIGITGASAGGHLALMIATAGDDGNPDAIDPVERVSSRVQAAGCFFPPTDFLNYGKPGVKSIGIEPDHQYKAPFDFHRQDAVSKLFLPVDLETREEICRDCSPVYHVSADDPPTIIIQGDADLLVPLQQAESMIDSLKHAGVPAELVVVKGGGHGWLTMLADTGKIANWFDKYLPAASADAATH